VALAFKSFQWAAAVLLIVAAGFVTSKFVPSRTPHRTAATAESRSQPRTEPVPTAPKMSVKQEPIQLAVNLASFSPPRGTDTSQTAQAAIHLPPKVLHIRFILPVGMEPGEYAVRLEDAAGVSKIERQVKVMLTNGEASFDLDLDLKAVATGARWTLMIRESGMTWRKYPVIVG